MKFTVILLLLAAFSHAAEQESSRTKKKEDNRTDKRALVEGNAGVEKRTPVIAAVLPSATPGIVYADSNQLTDDKVPQQDVYATPVPQLAKISDLLTGQEGQHYQAAIVRHLFSPVSVYQTRLPGYEVSAPIPSKLAYTEKITYQPQPQTLAQFTPQVFNQPQGQANIIRVTYPQQVEQYQQGQPQPQQVNYYQQLQQQQLQPVQYQQQQLQFLQIQPHQPIVYNQPPFQYQGPAQFAPQQLSLVQLRLPASNIQPGVAYAREQDNYDLQKESKTEQRVTTEQRQNVEEKPEQSYNANNQGAVSYASFSVGPAAFQPRTQNEQYQTQAQGFQNQPQPKPPQSQQIFQIQPQQSQVNLQPYQINSQQAQVQQRHSSLQNQREYQIQRQPSPQITQQRNQAVQYQQQQQQVYQQVQPKVVQKPEPSPSNSVGVPLKHVPLSAEKQQLNYFRAEPAYHPQVYQGQQLVIPNQFASQQVETVPTFPPVQFFGKFAHELFRNYQPQ